MLPNQPEIHEDFVKSLLLEWEQKKDQLHNRTLKSIYFGGGTPALLSPQLFEKILSKLSLNSAIEITLEANPENLNFELLKDFKSLGINRLSLGAQSFDDRLLKILSRTHDSKATLFALSAAEKAGFENISIDLMYDLPNQTREDWLETLKIASNQPITHLSLYNLTIEPETVFFKKRNQLVLPNQEESLFMYQSAEKILSSAGLIPYEISAFAKPGYYSRHNVGYWTAREFLGLGPSAFSYFNQERFRNVPHYNKYKKALNEGLDPKEEPDHLTADERRKELLAVEIRLRRGVDLTHFQKRHGKLTPETEKSLQELIHKGWVQQKENTIKLTPNGILFYDSVAVELI